MFKGVETGIKLPRILVGSLDDLFELDSNFSLEVGGIFDEGKSKILKVRPRPFSVTLVLRRQFANVSVLSHPIGFIYKGDAKEDFSAIVAVFS